MFRFAILVFMLCLILPAALSAQHRGEVGRPYLKNYSAAEYDAHVWNSSAVQDNRGVLYVGNNDGLLEYDGVSWRLIVLPGRSHARSLGRDAEGRIWVGGFGDFGYIAPDSLGQTVFVSVLHQVPPELRNFSVILGTYPTPDGVYFASRERLFRYSSTPGRPSSGVVEHWELDPTIDHVYYVQEQLYIWQQGMGLSRLTGGQMVLAPGGSRFADETITAMLSYDDTLVLIGTRTSGFFLYDGRRATPFATEADELLLANRFVSSAALPGGRFALGTYLGGLLVIDREGRLLHRIDTSLGLQNNFILGIYPGEAGSLWLLLDNGISRVDIDSPLTLFDEHTGLSDVALVVHRHAGHLYVGATTGLMRLIPDTGKLVAVGNLNRGVHALLSIGRDLLVASTAGVYVLTEGQLVPVHSFANSGSSTYTLASSTRDSSIVYVGFGDGLGVLRRQDGAWIDVGRVPGVNRFIRTIVVESDDTVWLGTENAGAYRLRFPDAESAALERVEAVYYGVDQGLPDAGATAYLVGDKAYFTSFGAHVYSFDPSTERFVRDSTFDGAATGYPLDWFGLFEDVQGRVWIPVGNRGMSMMSRQTDGSYRADPGPLRRLGSVLIMVVYPENDGVVWMAGSDGLIRYDTNQEIQKQERRPALIRRVTVKDDSLLFAGMGPLPGVNLAYTDNSIRFDFAYPSFVGPTEYRTRLDGFDEIWSVWRRETDRVYTNLPEGDYTFWVAARDIDGRESRQGIFTFSVSPPWWRTSWAYALFGVLLVGLFYGFRRYEMGRLQLKHGLELERVESEKLRELDQMKSNFFTNISHEFRTPLTLILGPVADAMDKGRDLPIVQLPLVRRNGTRLLRLINQLLDLSKLEAGAMRLRATRADLIPLLKSIVYSFESLAKQKKVDLRFESERENIFLDFEQDRLEQVFYNLLANAFKFTPTGGSITVECSVTEERFVTVGVHDTGIGISEERLPRIFDRFYQADTSHTRDREGTGIGLALTKAFVELHHGEISVTSELGRGASFIVRLPFDDSHLPEKDRSTEPHKASHISAAMVNFESQDVETEVALKPTSDEIREIVLIVEDQEDVRAYLRSHLEDRYSVLEAVDGEAGLSRAQEVIPDLIVTDVMMPKMDGYALSRALRSDERTSHIPIVMLTARAAEEDKLEGLETGVDDYLLKPFSPKELRVRVRNLIELRRNLRARFSTATVIKPSEVAATSIDRDFLERVVASIEAHLEEEQFTVEDLAGDVGMSVSQLNRKLNALIDQPAGELMRSIRLQRAADLLERRAGTVAEIAYRVGFSNQAHFSTTFKKRFGVSPSAYRKG